MDVISITIVSFPHPHSCFLICSGWEKIPTPCQSKSNCETPSIVRSCDSLSLETSPHWDASALLSQKEPARRTPFKATRGLHMRAPCPNRKAPGDLSLGQPRLYYPSGVPLVCILPVLPPRLDLPSSDSSCPPPGSQLPLEASCQCPPAASEMPAASVGLLLVQDPHLL